MKVTFNDKELKKWMQTPPTEGQRVYVEKRVGVDGSLALLHSPGGRMTWRAIHYVNGKPRGAKLGVYPAMSIAEARRKQAKFELPQDALQPGRVKSFGEVARVWLQERVDRRGLRTARELRRHLEKYVLPHWGTSAIHAIRRSHVNDLLRSIGDNHGYVQADAVLSTLSSLFRWYAVQDDEFNPPIVTGMRRDPRPAEEQKRSRVLKDDEIRALWTATEEPTPYNGLVRFLLLSAQRWSKVVGMQQADLAADGLWTLPRESREKGTIGAVKLPSLALKVIAAAPQIGSRFVFPAVSGGRLFNTVPENARLDKRMAEALGRPVENFTHHDLRRTARSLMARAGVPREHAERVMGHVQPGVEGTYDRHDYGKEKADALEALARMIGEILDPTAATNVVPLRRSRAG